MKAIKLLAVLIIIATGLFLQCFIATGADTGLRISPPMKDLTVEPGSEQIFDVMLENSSDQKTENILVWRSSIEQKQTGSYSLSKENSPFSAVSWLEIKTEKDRLTLPPKSSAAVMVKLKVPRNAFGSRVAAIVFEVVPNERKTGTQGITGSNTFTHRLITIIKITVNSRANRKQASINNFSVADTTSDSRFAPYGQKALAVICTVSNDGNTLFAANGSLIIRNHIGRRIQEAPLGAGRGIILPGAKVELVSVFPEGIADGEYTVETVIPYGGSRPLLAKIPFKVTQKEVQKGDSQIQNVVHLNVSPEKFETQLPGGAFRTFIFSLKNNEKIPVKVRGVVKDITTGTNGELMPLEGNPPSYSAVPWLKLEQNDIVLEPGGKKILRAVAMIPKSVSAGTRYATVILEAEKMEAAGTVTIISTPMVITVGKNLTPKAALNNLTVFKDPSGVWIIAGQLMNQGNTHFSVSGKLILRYANKPKKSDGLEVLSDSPWNDLATIPLVESPGWLLPGERRSIFALYNKELALGEYQAEFQVEVGDKLPVSASCIFKLAPTKK